MVNVVDNPVAVRYNQIDRNDVPNFVCILIEEGEFEGVVYHYENMKIGGQDEDDPMLLFNYHIVEKFWSDGMFEGKMKDRFEETVACILHDILMNQVGRIGNEDRTDDSKESGS
jgi:hypothetical protein